MSNAIFKPEGWPCCIVSTVVCLGSLYSGSASAYSTTAVLEWVRQIGTSEVDEADSVASDGMGNVYLAGGTYGVLGNSNAGGGDAYLRKYDLTGNLQWTQQFGTPFNDQAFAVAGDHRGGSFVAGYTGASPTGIGNSNAFVRRYDGVGNLQWDRALVTSQDDYAHGLSTDGSNRLYVSGVTRGSLAKANAGQLDAYIAQYDYDGNLQWSRQWGSPGHDYGFAAAADGLGNVYVTGFTFGSLAEPSLGFEDAYIAKFSAVGDLQWIRQFGTPGEDRSLGISADTLGNVFVTGNTSAKLGDATFGGADIFISRFDDAGFMQWTLQLGTAGSDTGRALATDGKGNVYFSGATSDSLGEQTAGSGDIVVGKASMTGELLWLKQIGGADHEVAFGVSFDGHSNLYAAGYTTGDLGGAHAGRSDAFVLRLREIPEPESHALFLLACGIAAGLRCRVMACGRVKNRGAFPRLGSVEGK